MSVEILMPQLGESVVEGTVSRWLIAEGQPVQQDEPLLQVTTDKVDTDLPAPASGILLKIFVPAGQTVAMGTVLGVIGDQGSGVRGQESHGDASRSGVRSQGSGIRDQGSGMRRREQLRTFPAPSHSYNPSMNW
jgi:2-oxoglutarate dehydrogenase E2 component (dihydrolipoamide succinyltransferase)